MRPETLPPVVQTERPLALVVGVDQKTAGVCWSGALEAGFRFARVAHGPAAVIAMRELRPNVVLVARTLWRDEREAVARVAMEQGASIVELPTEASAKWLAVAIRRSNAIARSR